MRSVDSRCEGLMIKVGGSVYLGTILADAWVCIFISFLIAGTLRKALRRKAKGRERSRCPRHTNLVVFQTVRSIGMLT